MNSRYQSAAIAVLAAALTCPIALLPAMKPAQADTVQARCDYYPRGEDRASASMPCTFSQRQGFITIRRQDGVTHEFRPDPNRANVYLDRQGGTVNREDSESSTHEIYRTSRESIYVYWNSGNSSTNPAGNGSNGGNSTPSSTTPVTYMRRINQNQIAVQITEGEFRFHGNLNRTSGNMFVGQDRQVRVMYDRTTKRMVVINVVTGTEFYNYIFSDVNEGAL